MIKARLEIKKLRVWLTCISLFLCGAIMSAPFLGLIDDELLYWLMPFLDFGLIIEGSVFGRELPSFVTDNFSFAVSLACVMAMICLTAHIIYVVVLNVLRGQHRHAASVLKRTGYSREYFELLEHKSMKLKGSSLASTNDLCLAKEYCDGRRYESALEILRNIDIDNFDVKDAARYYSLYAYIFVLTGNLKNARFAVDLGVPFAEKLKDHSEADFVSALILYAERDYDGALTAFSPLLKSKNASVRVWSGMYTGLIHLRKHNKEAAREIAVTLSKYKKTPRQSEDMLKLLKKIEAAYAIEAEENAEKERAMFSVPSAG